MKRERNRRTKEKETEGTADRAIAGCPLRAEQKCLKGGGEEEGSETRFWQFQEAALGGGEAQITSSLGFITLPSAAL
jgi:hypothetical protein